MADGPVSGKKHALEPGQKFEFQGTRFLGRAMLMPVMATGGYVCVVAPDPWYPIALTALYIAGNLSLRGLIWYRLDRGEEPGAFVGIARGLISLILVPLLVMLAGTDPGGWVPTVPALLALPFVMSTVSASSSAAALIGLVSLARLSAGVSPETVGVEALGLTAIILVTVPVASAMRDYVNTLRALQIELRHQFERAEASSRAKGSFLAQMSHEIRTPLNGIIGSLELLSRAPASDGESLLEAARTSADGLLDLVDDILDLSKVEAGHMKVDLQPTHAPTLLVQVRNAFDAMAVERGVELRLGGADAVPPWAMSDPVRLRQVVFNLVSNAVKFTRQGTVTVRFEALDGSLGIAVEDTGPGMTPDVLDRVFDPFEQAEPGHEGTGLGLSLVLRLTRLLGGHLDAHSVPGQGSRFDVVVPWIPCEAPPRASAGRPAVDASGARVLVVEDNPINQRVVRAMLDRLECESLLAETASEAVEMADGAFDLILMDVHLPDYDGFNATMRIRKKGVQTPIWALTAGALVEDRARATEAGMDGFLTKPVRLDELAETLHRVRAARAAPAPEADRAAAPTADGDSRSPDLIQPSRSPTMRGRPTLDPGDGHEDP